MNDFGRDLKYALRQLRRTPAFSLVVLATLGLGIGSNAAIFSVFNGLLLQPLPYADPGRLVQINHFYPSLNNLEASVSAPGFRDYRERLERLQSVAAQGGWGVNLVGDGEPERLNGARVSANYFSTYGIPAANGRLFQADEEAGGGGRVVVLSDGLWRRRFGGEVSVLGRTLNLNGEPYVVVGILPRDFRPFFNRTAEIFSPLFLTPQQLAGGYTNEFLTVTARLAPGATPEQAQAEATSFAENLKRDRSLPPDWGIRLTSLDQRARGDLRAALWVLLGAVGFVLLIACANVANLLLARGAGRTREVAVRLAIGAGPGHLLRQLLAEALVLSVAGGAVGLFLAYWGVRLLARANPGNLPRVEQVSLDLPVLGFTLAVTLGTALLFGLLPALQAARMPVQEVLREGAPGAGGSRSGAFTRRMLVAAEFAIAVALLVGAGLLLKSFAKLTSVSPGFDPQGLLTFQINLPAARYPSDTVRIAFFDRLLERLAATPGVEAVGATSTLPFSGSWSTGSFQVEGYSPAQGEPSPWGDIRVVSPGFDRAMGIQMIAGRFLDETDRLGGEPTVVVDQEAARRFWPNRDPLSGRVTFDGNTFFRVVGVVAHTAHEGLDADPRVQIYFPQRGLGVASMFVAVRSRTDAGALVPAARAAVRTIDSDQPISNLTTMDELMGGAVGPRRLLAGLLAAFAAFALLLAATGVYGVMSLAVSHRTREFGVRMAMGAARPVILGAVMRQGLALAGVGVVVGGLGAAALSRLLTTQLYQVRPLDAVVFAVVPGILLLVASASTLLPALRATRVDPASALRME
jgi:putative ABC transport system permease protein